MIDLKELVKAGVHFGHKKSRWHPKMAPYIWGHRSNIHLIDVSRTAKQLEYAAEFLKKIAGEGKTILWVGTKKSAQEVIAAVAKKLGYPFVIHRWIGGTLTNFSQVKKSITKLLHFEDIIKKADTLPYTKKEIVTLQKMVDRLQKNVGSIKNITLPIGAVVLVDVKKEQTALREAHVMQIPTVGIVDTNSDPSLVDYVIPSNDDAPKAIAILIQYLADAVETGQKEAAEKPKEEIVVIEEEVVEVPQLLAEDDEGEAADKTEKKQIKKMRTKEPVKIKKGASPRLVKSQVKDEE